jgi:hypothetical protein
MVRKIETFPPVTMAHIRGHGCRDLLIYCNSGRCYHSATLNGDWLADNVPVRSLCGRMVCTRCGYIGAAFSVCLELENKVFASFSSLGPGRLSKDAANMNEEMALDTLSDVKQTIRDRAIAAVLFARSAR